MTQNHLNKNMQEGYFKLSHNNNIPIQSFQRIFLLGMITCFICLLTGCSIQQLCFWKKNLTASHSIILKTSYQAGEALSHLLNKKDFDKNQALITASFVNIDNLKESSTLGRMISEQIGNRLSQLGYQIVELKLRQDSVFIKEREGEFLLSRELQQISETHSAEYVLVGTYAISEYIIYVSARLVQTSNNHVASSYDYQLPIDDIVRSLIGLE